MTKSVTSERSAEYKRVRIYQCPYCETRLFTHEEPTPEPFSTQCKQRRIQLSLDWHPCRCGQAQFIRIAYDSASMYPLMYYRYTCTRCGATWDTAERIAGQSREITPRNKRGRFPHPLR